MAIGMIFSFLTTTFTPIFIAGIVYTLGEIVYTPSVQTLGVDLMNPEKLVLTMALPQLRCRLPPFLPVYLFRFHQ